MRRVILTRQQQGDSGTFGQMVTDTGLKVFCGELPWRDNKPQVSCIPGATYTVEWKYSPAHDWCYHVLNVPGRDAIEIHSANFMGDATKINPATAAHYLCQLKGCIAPGLSLGTLGGQDAVLSSRAALAKFEQDLTNEAGEHLPFELIIHDIVVPCPNGEGID